ncbi:MAG TPA: hypothetical protein VJR89_41790 [Polyangiales bacterium]|nr:hypothetical protein [Polyangiales bacterium]
MRVASICDGPFSLPRNNTRRKPHERSSGQNMRRLKRGVRGRDVLLWQRFLAQLRNDRKLQFAATAAQYAGLVERMPVGQNTGTFLAEMLKDLNKTVNNPAFDAINVFA